MLSASEENSPGKWHGEVNEGQDPCCAQAQQRNCQHHGDWSRAGRHTTVHGQDAGWQPSRADEMLTQTLEAALALVDVRVLDHIVVGKAGTVSFAERGLC